MGISTATELIILNPSILGDKSIHNLLHSQIWDELILGQFLTRHRVKVTNPLWIESYTTSHQQEIKRNLMLLLPVSVQTFPQIEASLVYKSAV